MTNALLPSQNSEVPRHASSPKRLMPALFFGVIAFAIFGGAFALWASPLSLPTVTSPFPTDESSLFSSANVNPFNDDLKNTDGRTNVLFLGISGEEYISGNLTDTIMVASIDNETGNVHLFSIPRDLWVGDYRGSFTKINELYRLAGGPEAPSITHTGLIRDKVEEIFGLPIHYTAVVTLAAIADAVDLMGGVVIDGEVVDGDTAVFFVRDRSMPRGDFARMEHQQQLLAALGEKLLAQGNDSEALISIYETLRVNSSIDATLPDIFAFYRLASRLSFDNLFLRTITPAQQSLLYSGTTDIAGKDIYTLHPTAGKEDYSKIQQYIENELN